MKATRRRVRSTGLSLAVTECVADENGSASAHVVLVHGYPDSSRMWVPVAERLADAGLHVVTYDVRGAGASWATTGGRSSSGRRARRGRRPPAARPDRSPR